MINAILNYLFPETCPSCRAESIDHRTAPVCPACWDSVHRYQGPRCSTCSKPLHSDTSTHCSDCLTDPPGYASSSIFGLYEGVLKDTINHFKYFRKKRLVHPLAERLCTCTPPAVDAVIPVPLHRSRLLERGFNQSALLARRLAEKHSLPLLVNTLVRIRDTGQQVGLRSQERRKNIRGAFSVADSRRIAGKSLLLVDDVITTGATVREGSRQLLHSGAKEVHVIALARGSQD